MKNKDAECLKTVAGIKEFMLSVSGFRGCFKNTLYPKQVKVKTVDDFVEAIKFDHLCGKFKDGKRGKEFFLSSDVLCLDVDNDHSDDKEDWITPETVAEGFPNVSMIIVPSIHNNKEKKGKSSRPRFHVYMQIPELTDAKEYVALKKRIYEAFPYFDTQALDAARVIRGAVISADEVIVIDGNKNIVEYLDAVNDNAVEESDEKVSMEMDEDAFLARFTNEGVIKVGSRNGTLHAYAVRVLKRFGNTSETREKYEQMSDRCEEPLPDAELEAIWNSAVRFYEDVISIDDGYIPPDQYVGSRKGSPKWMFPETDRTDMGEAAVFYSKYGNVIAYTDETGFLVYDGTKWDKGDKKAFGLAQTFLNEQHSESMACVEDAKAALVKSGIPKHIVDGNRKDLEKVLTLDNMKAYKAYLKATEYFDFVQIRRNQKYIKWMMDVVSSMVLMDINDFDTRWWLLNTPAGTYDLRKGLDGLQHHDPKDYITHITSVSPGIEGKDLWDASLDKYFLGDNDMIEYMQHHCGEMSYGKIFNERLNISVGDGANGKTSFYGACYISLGTYAGRMSAEAFVKTKGVHNYRPEIAGLKGKRFVIISELGDELDLNIKMIKDLTSAEVEIAGEYKYQNPFSFIPTHSLVLYTNELPFVSKRDKGTWRRILVIPFDAVISEAETQLGYNQFLADNAGPAVLSWLIEGAKKAFECGFKYAVPMRIQEATSHYRVQSDWFADFVSDNCVVDPDAEEKSGELEDLFKSKVKDISVKDFRDALKREGYDKKRKTKGVVVKGLRIRDDISPSLNDHGEDDADDEPSDLHD